MKHLVRVGAVLLVILLVVLVVPRVIPAPAFLTDYGFHERNDEKNIKEWVGLPVQYASSSICVDCHHDESILWQKGDHRTLSCEGCHGPAGEHLETQEPPIIEHDTRELCGLCHAQLISRPSNFPQVDMAEMGREAECVSCHDPHEPRAGMPPEVPHTLEERDDCQVCHGPAEPWTVTPPEPPHTMEGRSDCISCHGPHELRGATLPHLPHSLEGRSDCLLCHNVGGIRPLPEDHIGRKSTTCLNCHQSE